MDYRLASFLIPWGVIIYTAAGGLKATFIASYIHTVIIFAVLVTMVLVVYIKGYSSDQIYDYLEWTISYTPEECAQIFSNESGTFFDETQYACGPVPNNSGGSYLTMLSGNGLMFGIINIVGNFGTVFVDQSYWQSAIAARPASAAKGYLLGGICWFAIPFSLATSLGLASTALLLPITATEAGNGLVPPAVAEHLLGDTGAVLILIMLFMAIVSTGSAESIAVSSLVSYDIYREYFNPEATGEDILKVSRIVIVVFGLFMGAFSILLDAIGLGLGWVYLFMGIIIGSAVIPLWNLMTWDKASGKGAVIAAWTGLILSVSSWLIAAKITGGEVTVATLGTDQVMLSGNLVAILSSGFIHYVYSKFIDPRTMTFPNSMVRSSLSRTTRLDLKPSSRTPRSFAARTGGSPAADTSSLLSSSLCGLSSPSPPRSSLKITLPSGYSSRLFGASAPQLPSRSFRLPRVNQRLVLGSVDSGISCAARKATRNTPRKKRAKRNQRLKT